MRRKITIALLAFGTVGGFSWGFGSMRHRGEARRAAFERHVASICVDAAREAGHRARSAAAAAPAEAQVDPGAAR